MPASARCLSGAGRTWLPLSCCLPGYVPRNTRPVRYPALSSQRRLFPSAPGALPVRLQPLRVLLTARVEWGSKLKLTFPRERNFVFMYKVCDSFKESTATCAFMNFKTAIECPILLPLKSMARVSLTQRGQEQFLPVFCIIVEFDMMKFAIGTL